MSELLGTQTGMPCSISDECITVMSTRGMNGYGITHQILYTMLAEQVIYISCSKGIIYRIVLLIFYLLLNYFFVETVSDYGNTNGQTLEEEEWQCNKSFEIEHKIVSSYCQ